MDRSLVTQDGAWRLLTSAIVALALVMSLGAASASAASQGCSVKNKTTGRTYSTLQAAVYAAQPRATLLVRGTCRGATTIRKDLVIQGVESKRLGKPILDGRGKVRPLKIRGRAGNRVQVALREIVIRDGRATKFIHQGWGGYVGGGIVALDAEVRLRDVVVRGCRARDGGGGIYASWAYVWLNGNTRIVGNQTRSLGGGIYGHINSVLTLGGRSSIVANRAQEGGGAWLVEALLRLDGQSAIARNFARLYGGGVSLSQSGVVLNGSAAIRGNRARIAGGGTFDSGGDGDEYPGSHVEINDGSSISGNRALAADSCCGEGCVGPRSRGGGIHTGAFSTLKMTGAGTVTGNHAACGAGGVHTVQVLQTDLIGVTCGPGGNIHSNTPSDCSFAD